MKKILLLSVLCLTLQMAFSQEDVVLKNKSGAIILPEKGDLSFSIDAVPFLCLLNNKGGNPGFNFTDSIPSISVKYMISEKGGIILSPIIKSVGTYRDGKEANVTGSLDGIKTQEFGLRLGYERRHGESRLQIPYGAEVGLSKIKKSFWSNLTDGYNSNGIKYFASVYLGAEYFFLPKMSIGGRFNYTYNRSEIKYSNSGPFYYTAHITDLNYGNLGGALLLAFYF